MQECLDNNILMYLTDNESKSKIAELQKHKRPKSIKHDS